MTWSFSARGKAPAVSAEIAKQLETSGKCIEPEESVRQAASRFLTAALAAQSPETDVEAVASGSQSNTTAQGISNSATISLRPR